MIPLKDENPTSSPAVVTWLLIAACVVVYFFVQPAGQATFLNGSQTDPTKDLIFNIRHAAIPCELTQGRPLTVQELDRTFNQGDDTACDANADAVSPEFDRQKNVWLAALYSMFLHGSLLHIAGNMLFLWVFGNNIEDRMGKLAFLGFYLLGGVAATATHVLLNTSSTVPIVGASGAIAAVMGAYLVLFPNAPIRTIIIFYLILFRDISAKWLLLFWFVSQFFVNPNEGVAWAAHVGGFVFGALVAFLFRDHLRPPPRYEPFTPAW